MSIQIVTPLEVFKLCQQPGGITLIDVREVDEFAELASPYAKNHPLSTFDAKDLETIRDSAQPVYLLCRSGKRSMKAAQTLEGAGHRSIFNVEGGMLAWEAAGLPVVRKP